jgi:hypothetical protein
VEDTAGVYYRVGRSGTAPAQRIPGHGEPDPAPGYVLHEYMEHYHHERNHQGKGNVVLFPTIRQDTARQGSMQCRERLGGLLKYYEREAA